MAARTRPRDLGHREEPWSEPSPDAEVAVIGTGSIGSMTLWQLARAGVDAIGFEQFAPGHDQAAAGGESRIFRTAYLEGPQYVPLLTRARELWRELEEESGFDLLTLNGGLMIGHRDSETMTNVLASARDFDLPHRVLDAAEMRREYPQHAWTTTRSPSSTSGPGCCGRSSR